MVEYIIRVEFEMGTFLVHAGYSKSFAEKMFETFTLRDKDNQPIPHSKLLMEAHHEPERPEAVPICPEASRGIFEDFEGPPPTPQEKLREKLIEAERAVDAAVWELETPIWVKRHRDK